MHYVLFPDVTNAQKLYDIRILIEKFIAENEIKILKFYDGKAPDPSRMKFS